MVAVKQYIVGLFPHLAGIEGLQDKTFWGKGNIDKLNLNLIISLVVTVVLMRDNQILCLDNPVIDFPVFIKIAYQRLIFLTPV